MSALDGDVKVPGMGSVSKKRAAIVIGAVAAVIVAVLVIRGRSASADSAASPADTSGSSPADGSNLDPAGYVIGSPDDIAWQDSQSGTSDYGGGGSYGTNVDGGGYPIGSPQDIQWQTTQTTGITTNAEWVAAAEAQLPGNPAAVQAALFGVLGGQTVTTAQKDLFLEAVGVLEPPPQGYPTPIKTSDTSGHPGPSPKVTVPKVTGQSQEAAFAILAAAGFHSEGTPVVHGETLIVDSQEPRAGSTAAKGSTVTLHSAPRAPRPPVPPRLGK